MRNLLYPLPPKQPDETVDVLVKAEQLRVERIVSWGHVSPPDFWYDQPWDEWVVLLTGRAALQIAGELSPRELRPGDSVQLPAHVKHRVESTAADEPTIWLAVHYVAKSAG